MFPLGRGTPGIQACKTSLNLFAPREDNVLTHVKIFTSLKLDPKPSIDQGAESFEKLGKISLTDDKHYTQIGERMQGPHRE
ncbi:hypothetical protein CR513_50974, partial [Mucuna pruriens]